MTNRGHLIQTGVQRSLLPPPDGAHGRVGGLNIKKKKGSEAGEGGETGVLLVHSHLGTSSRAHRPGHSWTRKAGEKIAVSVKVYPPTVWYKERWEAVTQVLWVPGD